MVPPLLATPLRKFHGRQGPPSSTTTDNHFVTIASNCCCSHFSALLPPAPVKKLKTVFMLHLPGLHLIPFCSIASAAVACKQSTVLPPPLPLLLLLCRPPSMTFTHLHAGN